MGASAGLEKVLLLGAGLFALGIGAGAEGQALGRTRAHADFNLPGGAVLIAVKAAGGGVATADGGVGGGVFVHDHTLIRPQPLFSVLLRHVNRPERSIRVV